MWERKTWWYHTSISARGVSAETESTHIRSTAPERHIRSATVQSNEERKQVSFYMKIRFKTRDLRMFWDYLLSKAISPLSGWHTMRFSTSTPNALEYDGSKACSASTSIALPPSFCTSEIAWSASVVLPLLSGPYICSIKFQINHHFFGTNENTTFFSASAHLDTLTTQPLDGPPPDKMGLLLGQPRLS